jgi:predicted DCC family thiol-disulfide oxidoreductase YuxK
MMPREPYSYRHDAGVPPFPDTHPILVFDGFCALCSGWAEFILRHDGRERFRLLPAQSELGRALYVHYGLDPQDYETNILIDGGRAYFKSEACIRMLESLGFPWTLAAALRVMPLGLRDGLYDWVARHRLRLFGTRQSCYVASPRSRSRFLT